MDTLILIGKVVFAVWFIVSIGWGLIDYALFRGKREESIFNDW